MDDKQNFDETQQFHINYQNVLATKEFMAVTRMLAADLMSNPYMTVSDFMRKLSDEELHTLGGIAEDEENPRMEELILICEMLAEAEGLEHANLDILHERINQFCIFIALEGLSRANLIKLHYENMSFGEDCKDKILAEKPE